MGVLLANQNWYLFNNIYLIEYTDLVTYKDHYAC